MESNRLLNPARHYEQVVSNLNEFTAELKSVDLTARIPEFVSAIDKINIQSTLEGSDPKNHFNNTISQLQGQLSAMKPAAVDSSTVNDILREGFPRLGSEPAEEAIEKIGQAVKAHFDRTSNELANIINRLDRQLEQLRTGQNRFDELGAELAASLGTLIAEIRTLQGRQSVELTTAIGQATAAINLARRQLNSARTAELADRNIVSFWMPTVAAACLVLAAVSLGWPTMLGR